MVSKEGTERLLYWAISFFVNLILFSFLSVYLIIKHTNLELPQPLNLYLETTQEEVRELKTKLQREPKTARSREGEGVVNRGKDSAYSAPLEVERREGDTSVPAGKSKEEPSLLSEIEAKVSGKNKEVNTEGQRQKVGEELGSITAVVSSGGVDIGGGSRGVVYMPPFPRLVSDEPLGVLRLRIWVEPSGKVSRVEIVQRSGSVFVDQRLVEFVKNIRFEPIGGNVVQTGILTFRFKGG